MAHLIRESERKSGALTPRISNYRCVFHYARGATVCPNARTLPMAEANTAVLATLQHDVLTVDAVARVVTAALDTVRDRPDTHAQDRATVQAERTG